MSTVVGSCLTSGSGAPGVNCWGSPGPWTLNSSLSFLFASAPVARWHRGSSRDGPRVPPGVRVRSSTADEPGEGEGQPDSGYRSELRPWTV